MLLGVPKEGNFGARIVSQNPSGAHGNESNENNYTRIRNCPCGWRDDTPESPSLLGARKADTHQG